MQAVDLTCKIASRRPRGTTLQSLCVDQGPPIWRSVVGSATPSAASAKLAAGRGARGGAQQEALAVLLELGLGEGVQIGNDGGPGSADAVVGGGETVLQFLFQH